MDQRTWELTVFFSSAAQKAEVVQWLYDHNITAMVEGVVDGLRDLPDGEAALRFDSLADRSPVALYFDNERETERLGAALTSRFSGVECSAKALCNSGWQQAWEQAPASFSTNLLQIILDEDPQEVEPHKHVIRIASGRSFGNGQHATTKACIHLMEAHRELFDGAMVLDLGTGNGILGTALAMLTDVGYMVATDIDEVAVSEAQAHFKRNRVKAEVRLADAVPRSNKPYTAILCNVLLPELVRLLPTMVGAMAPGATLVTAGYTSEDAYELLTRANQLRLTVVSSSVERNWQSHLFVRG